MKHQEAVATQSLAANDALKQKGVLGEKRERHERADGSREVPAYASRATGTTSWTAGGERTRLSALSLGPSLTLVDSAAFSRAGDSVL